MLKPLEKLKRSFAIMAMIALFLQFTIVRVTDAAGPGAVVINEVAWAGSSDSSSDEWIELYNNTSAVIDLSGWVVEDDGGASVYTIESGEIPGYGYFLIEDNESAVSSRTADALIGLSLANSGDSLSLKDANGAVIDIVNAAGVDWYAGGGANKASMERIDPTVSTDSEENWASATGANGAKSSGNSDIIGTPGGVNSNFSGGIAVTMSLSDASPSPGETLEVEVEVSEVEDLFAYGIDLIYDPSVLKFLGAEETNLLKEDGESTSFYSGLENNQEGTLVVGNVRLSDPPGGIDANGVLFTATFELLAENENSTLNFGGKSFLADSNTDLPVGFEGTTFGSANAENVGTIQNVNLEEADERYSLELSWELADGEVDKYQVYRKNFEGNFVLLGETEYLSFIDNNSLIPNLEYEYKVVPIKNALAGNQLLINGSETRGLKGDNDRSDRVDGRDLENLARAFGSVSGEENFEILADTNMDGLIDGSDLIDIGVNFAKTY